MTEKCGYPLAHVNRPDLGRGPSPCALPAGHGGWHDYLKPKPTPFYAEWDAAENGGEPAPMTLEEKISFGVSWYSGDSGVSQGELEEYLRDLVLTRDEEIARFLLAIGFGIDFSSGGRLPPVPVLEAMVRIGAADGFYVDQGDPEEDRLEGMYYVLSEELGDWRNES